jgi:hypothetical protein
MPVAWSLAEASVIDYWQFQNERPLVRIPAVSEEEEEVELFPTFHVLKLFAETFPADTQILSAKVIGEDLYAIVGTEPDTGSWRVLLVNVGGAAEVVVTGGQPRAEYSIDVLDRATAERMGSKNGTEEASVATMKTNDSGLISVAMLPSSVVALSAVV